LFHSYWADRLRGKTGKIPVDYVVTIMSLETGGGTSRLFLEHNNAFGIKCHSKSCAKGHCVNAHDDHHKDFFINFDSVEASVYEFVRMLSEKDRYKGAEDADTFLEFVSIMKRGGYATSDQYVQLADKVYRNYKIYM
jgi:uncharacterized FlgJ-related protein